MTTDGDGRRRVVGGSAVVDAGVGNAGCRGMSGWRPEGGQRAEQSRKGRAGDERVTANEARLSCHVTQLATDSVVETAMCLS